MKVYNWPGGQFRVIPKDGTYATHMRAKRLTAYLNSPEVMIKIEALAAKKAQEMLDEAIKTGKL